MQNDSNARLDKGGFGPRRQDVKTKSTELNTQQSQLTFDGYLEKPIPYLDTKAALTVVHYLCLFVIGLLTWGLLWSAFGDQWRWDGEWFRLAAVATTAWAAGQVLEALTGQPPLLAALLTGILARHFGILDMRQFTHIDGFLRKVYPVVILGKASLGWNLGFMRSNWVQVATLGVLPWAAELITLAACTYFLLGFPWIWGFLTGSLYASLSCAVVMPVVARIGARARPWPQLVCTAGGVDTALSVGVYGIIFTYIFVDADDTYKYCKATFTLLLGVAFGAAWGAVAGLMPRPGDRYVAEIRVLFVLMGGLFANFFTGNIGWGGTGGVAVLACNATAASLWARRGWPLNQHAASTVYRVLWAALEPTLFAFTGTFFVLNSTTATTITYGFAILAICLVVRMSVTALVCWDMTIKERLFICCTWIPKSIVEAVLGPVAINALLMTTDDSGEKRYAEDLLRLIVQLILITTPTGYILTKYLGPWLLRDSTKDNDLPANKRKSVTGSEVEVAVVS